MGASLSIFVSHSHEDNALCHALVEGLRNAGADVWYDEHNLGAGHLLEVIQRELGQRKIFIVILSKHAFASAWVRRETTWAYGLAAQDSARIILPVTAAPIDLSDFDPSHGWLFLSDFKRIEAPGCQPYPQYEAIRRILTALSLAPGNPGFRGAAGQIAVSASLGIPVHVENGDELRTTWATTTDFVIESGELMKLVQVTRQITVNGEFECEQVAKKLVPQDADELEVAVEIRASFSQYLRLTRFAP